MRGVVKRLTLVCLPLLCAAVCAAQSVNVEVGAPTMVAVGEVFRVEFSVNAKPEQFTPPKIEGADVLAGPTVSHGSSVSVVNGDITRSVNYSYTYVLQASAEGRFTIPPATVTVDGRAYTSRPTPIEVVREKASAGGGQPDAQGATGGAGSTRIPTAISPEDLLINAYVSRTDVYKGQPVKLTLKLYKRVQLGGVSGSKVPAFDGFWSQELPQNQNQQWQRETYAGKVYDAIVLSEYLLYPQQTGRLDIGAFELTAVAQVITQQRAQSVFDDFFGGGPMVEEVRRELKSRPLSVTVRELPAGAPAGFGGAVGNFSMEAALSSRSVAANSAATYTVKISGSGNLPLIQAPKISMPGSLEQYNIKTTESLSPSASGISGYRQFEYPFIARAEGLCTIDEVQFSYFNPESGRYVTLSVPAADLEVSADAGGTSSSGGEGLVGGLTREDIKVLGSDIRFIKIGDGSLRRASRPIMLSGLHFALLALTGALAVAAYYLLRHRMRVMGNVAVVRGKRANKAALARLKAADRFRREGDRRRFLEEMLRALWGYTGDRLNIPAADLTRENVREKLARRKVPAQLIESYIEVISDCELAQYSPERSGQVDALYRAGVEVISRMESSLK